MEVAGLAIYQNAQCQISQACSFSRNTDLTAWCSDNQYWSILRLFKILFPLQRLYRSNDI